jgi:hypothetical protein
VRINERTRGTQKHVNPVEVNVDTVYIRTDIERIETEDFTGWEYDEVQIDKNEFISQMTNVQDTQTMALLLSLLMSEVDMLKTELQEIKGGVI